MYEYTSDIDEPTHLYINGKAYEEPVTETPKEGTTEAWNVINLTEDNHPLHIHLGLFVVMDQTELINIDEFKACMSKLNDAIKCQMTNPGYVYHCHILDHEDNVMMRPLKIIR
ncbi:hypothetical protein GH714_042097 [Hevea brasiliensis]|uniref:Plastocyanin-like domain-containing protein n=1 Tax=Hevea brasiliensis TaxID=3981 RepID=A0A6A6MWP3_HEVBR|nr:hypothetical protein GH714_042097 [Hevea brasiliensis]